MQLVMPIFLIQNLHLFDLDDLECNLTLNQVILILEPSLKVVPKKIR